MVCFSTVEEDPQKDTLSNVKTKWAPEVRNVLQKPIILVGTKKDARDEFLKDKSSCPKVVKSHSTRDVSVLNRETVESGETSQLAEILSLVQNLGCEPSQLERQDGRCNLYSLATYAHAFPQPIRSECLDASWPITLLRSL